MYAIIEDSGSQIKVSTGDVIKVAIRDLAADAATITFDRVLLVGGPAAKAEGQDEDAKAQPVPTRIGTPYLEGAKVVGDVLGPGKTDRVMAWRFRRRKNVLKRKGHRQDYLKVKIISIEV